MILYHGTDWKFSEFRPNSFFTDSYQVAMMYACQRQYGPLDRPARVIMVDVDVGNVLHIPAGALELFQMRHGDALRFSVSDNDIHEWLERSGADTAVIHDLVDLGGTPTQYVVRDPKRIRMVQETVCADAYAILTSYGEDTSFIPEPYSGF